MGNLTECLKRSELFPDEKESIRESAKTYQTDEGFTREEAANQAIEDAITEVLSERAGAETYIESRGGVVPPAPTAEPMAPEEPVTEPPEPEVAPEIKKEEKRADDKLVGDLYNKITPKEWNRREIYFVKLSWPELFRMANKAYGGTQAEGAYTVKDAYDALETAINLEIQFNKRYELKSGIEESKEIINNLEGLISALPTQTKRTREQLEMQQFSTPHMHAYVMSWVANIEDNEVVLEPSAGTGSLVVHALNSLPLGKKITVYANELSGRRANLLTNVISKERIFRENAMHLNAVLPKEIRPSVVLMNPPFSADIRRPGKRDVMVAAKHIEEALDRLEPGGRLVALVGRGMAPEAPKFKPWWKAIQKNYDVRANIGISGKEYAKFGTTFDNQLLVIDKLAPSDKKIVTGFVDKVTDLLPLLEEVRNERTRAPKREYEAPGAPVEERVEGAETGVRPPTPIQLPTDVLPPGRRPERPPTERPGRREERPTGVPREPEGPTEVPPGRRPEREPRPIEDEGFVATGEGTIPTQPPTLEDVGERPPAPPGERKPDIERAEAEAPLKPKKKEKPKGKEPEATDAVFWHYEPEYKYKGAKSHPTPLAESAPMASVSIPNITYKIDIPQDVIDSGNISSSQLEVTALAGQAHSEFLPGGVYRRGFFIGNGTGVGKGTEIMSIILDNWNKGRKKAIFITESARLLPAAQRDVEWVGMDKNKIFDLTKAHRTVKEKEGIMFTSYAQLVNKMDAIRQKGVIVEPEKRRIDQIIEWVGEDFDGVLAFDESHNMANAIRMPGVRKDPAQRAIAGLELQRRLPKARVVYASATGATEVSNMAYLDRLGAWGEGTAFADQMSFIQSIDAGGIAAMEVVARDFKSMGMYESRSLSYEGVSYDMLKHEITSSQLGTYDTLAEGWRSILNNVEAAMVETGQDKSGAAKRARRSLFWNTHQRFFSTLLTSLQVPGVIKDIEKVLAKRDEKGDPANSVVLQLVNTGEATAERRKAQAAAEGIPLEDADMTPRDVIMQYVQNSFPTQRYEIKTDEEGREYSVPAEDSQGNPIEDPRAIARRDELLREIATIPVPESALDQIINHFGSDAIAEVTGRKSRLVRMPDGTVETQKVSKATGKRDANDFMAGKKRILIFSDAGATGVDYHSSLKHKNQQRRYHYLLQPGWRADKVMQGFGRTHRTNQASAPHYVLVTTNIAAQMRFLSSIARRLDQLGALTKGSRQATSQGMFDASFNLENDYARYAMQTLMYDIAEGKVPEVTLREVSDQMALNLLRPDGTPESGAISALDIKRFLNRLLSMNIGTMNRVFEAFIERVNANVAYAQANGTLDVGMEHLTAQSIKKTEQTVVNKGERGAEDSYYVKLELTDPTVKRSFESVMRQNPDFFARNIRSNKLYAFKKTVDVTDPKTGIITKRYQRIGQVSKDYIKREEATDPKKYTKIPEKEVEKPWNEELEKAPDTQTRDVHLITGALLPIWDKIEGRETRVYRSTTDDGEALLGRMVQPKFLQKTLYNLGVGLEVPKLSPEGFVREVMEKGNQLVLSDGTRIKRSLVSGENRLEVIPRFEEPGEIKRLEGMGAFSEIIGYKMRLFLPLDRAGSIFYRITKRNKVVEITQRTGEMPAGPGAPEGGAFLPDAFLPKVIKPRDVQRVSIITGYDEAGQPNQEFTTHPSVKDRSAFNNFWRRNFFKEGLLPDETFENRIIMESAKEEFDTNAEFLVYYLKKAIKEYAGVRYSSLTKREREAINLGLSGDHSAMAGFVDEIQEHVRAMRAHLDNLSGQVIRTQNELMTLRIQDLPAGEKKDNTITTTNKILAGTEEITDEDIRNTDDYAIAKAFMIMKIRSNLGEYLNRAYEAFDNPKWEKKVRKNDEVMDAAKSYLTEQQREAEKSRILNYARKQVEQRMPWQEMMKGPGSLEAKKQRRDAEIKKEFDAIMGREKTPTQIGRMTEHQVSMLVKAEIDHILNSAKEKRDLLSFLSTYLLGQKDLGILKRRKDIPWQIRDLLGEYKDPAYNYTRSGAKMAFLVADHDFLMGVRRAGLGVFLSLGKVDRFTKQVMPFEKETMTPLTGLWTTPEFAEGLEDALGPKIRNQFFKAWLRANAAIKFGKTALSPITAMRNFQSASFFTFINGHFSWFSKDGDHRIMGKAMRATWADLRGGDSLPLWEEYLRKLVKLGVLHTGVRSEELLQTFKDAQLVERQYNQVGEAIKNTFVTFPTNVYRAGDDFWKIVGFENEVASNMKHRKMTREEAEKFSAFRIRNGYPTYSHVPRAIRMLRRWPLHGPFVSFPWEIMRTTGNQFVFLTEDAKELGVMSAPVAKRVLGMAIVSSAAYMAVWAGMWLSGVSREEDEAMRSVGPEWQRNHNLVYIRMGDGRIWTWDASHLDPYAYLKHPINALLNNNNEGGFERLYDANKEIFEPFLGEEITFGAFYELVRNKRLDTGSKIYNEEAPFLYKTRQQLRHLRRRLQPGINSQLENLYQSLAQDKALETGREFHPAGEMATFFGFRFSPVNMRVALKYDAQKLNYALKDANSILGAVMSDPNRLDPSDIEDPEKAMVKAHERLFKDAIKSVKAAKTAGEDEYTIYKILVASGLSKRNISYIRRGKVPVWKPPRNWLRRKKQMAVALARTLEEKRKAVVELERRSAEIRARAYAREFEKIREERAAELREAAQGR